MEMVHLVRGVLINVRETPTGYVATALKAADQMTAQTFNDVGPLDEEEIARLDHQEKT